MIIILTFLVILKLNQVDHISNNMGNRRRIEIVGNILDAANGGTMKTKIMYIAFKL